MEIHGVEAKSEEEAEAIALEWMRDDFNVDHVDGGINSIHAEEEQ